MINRKTKFNFWLYLTVIFSIIGFSLVFRLILADYVGPISDPPSSNTQALINASTSAQRKLGNLKVNTDGNATGLVVLRGKVGIGTGVNNPAAKLDINGGIKVGADTVCDSSKKGTIKYNSVTKKLEFCDSNNWKEFKLLNPPCVSNCPAIGGCGTDICGNPCGVCPSDSYSANYCDNGNVVRDYIDYECNDGINTCEYTEIQESVENCEGYGCSGGVCCSDPCEGYSCGTRTNACGYSDSCGPAIGSLCGGSGECVNPGAIQADCSCSTTNKSAGTCCTSGECDGNGSCVTKTYYWDLLGSNTGWTTGGQAYLLICNCTTQGYIRYVHESHYPATGDTAWVHNGYSPSSDIWAPPVYRYQCKEN